MQNGHSDPDTLLRNLRSELRRRKLALTPPEPASEHAEPAPVIQPVSLSPVAPPPPEPAPPPLQKPVPQRLVGARGALERASSKNAAARGWPRFLRGLRRNQTAINESLVRAASSIIETAERLRDKLILLDRRVSNQETLSETERQQFSKLQHQLEEARADQLRAFEEMKAHQAEHAREMEAQFRRQFEDYQTAAAGHRQQQEALGKRIEEQAKHIREEQTIRHGLTEQLAEIQRLFGDHRSHVTRLDEQLVGQVRIVEEQRRQLLDLGYKMIGYHSEIGSRFERLTAHHLGDQKQLLELQNFVREHDRQAIQEARQFSELARQLTEQTETARTHWQKATEQNAGHETLIEAQRSETAKLRDSLAQIEKFVAAQQIQTAEEGRQFSTINDAVESQRSEVDNLRETLGQLQEFVAAQQTQTAEEGRQLLEIQTFVERQGTQNSDLQRLVREQVSRLDEFSAKVEEYQNDICARYHLTTEEFSQTKQQLSDFKNFVNSQHEQTIEEERQFRAHQEQLDDLRARLEQSRADLANSSFPEVEALRSRVAATQASLAIVRAHLEKAGSPEAIKELAPTLTDDLKKHQGDSFYLAFENKFRGPFEEIKERLRFYLPTIQASRDATENSAAVDLGCGRGEWLDLLKEHGYQAIGIDLNVCMVEECRSRGLNAQSGDAVAYLRTVAAGSHSLITGFHIVEHLSFEFLLDLFTEAFRILVPGGILILETPNPECPHVSSYSFYLDPTHRNPLPSELLAFCGREVGFGAVRVERLQPYLEDGVFQGHLDYAAIFTK